MSVEPANELFLSKNFSSNQYANARKLRPATDKIMKAVPKNWAAKIDRINQSSLLIHCFGLKNENLESPEIQEVVSKIADVAKANSPWNAATLIPRDGKFAILKVYTSKASAGDSATEGFDRLNYMLRPIDTSAYSIIATESLGEKLTEIHDVVSGAIKRILSKIKGIFNKGKPCIPGTNLNERADRAIARTDVVTEGLFKPKPKRDTIGEMLDKAINDIKTYKDMMGWVLGCMDGAEKCQFVPEKGWGAVVFIGIYYENDTDFFMNGWYLTYEVPTGKVHFIDNEEHAKVTACGMTALNISGNITPRIHGLIGVMPTKDRQRDGLYFDYIYDINTREGLYAWRDDQVKRIADIVKAKIERAKVNWDPVTESLSEDYEPSTESALASMVDGDYAEEGILDAIKKSASKLGDKMNDTMEKGREKEFAITRARARELAEQFISQLPPSYGNVQAEYKIEHCAGGTTAISITPPVPNVPKMKPIIDRIIRTDREFREGAKDVIVYELVERTLIMIVWRHAGKFPAMMKKMIPANALEEIKKPVSECVILLQAALKQGGTVNDAQAMSMLIMQQQQLNDMQLQMQQQQQMNINQQQMQQNVMLNNQIQQSLNNGMMMGMPGMMM